MEINDQQIITALQELVWFMNDRRAGYEQATKEATDPQSGQLYRSLSGQRAEMAEELNQIIKNHGGETEAATPAKDSLYQQWLVAQTSCGHHTKESNLDASIFGEEWTQKAYQNALHKTDWPQPMRQLLERHKLVSEHTLLALQEIRHSRPGGA